MINIYIPNNNIYERQYIIDIIFGEFLGLDYEVVIDDSDSWVMVLENGNRLIVKDNFFNRYSGDLEYLQNHNIPKEVKFVKSKFASEDDIVVIYGDEGEERVTVDSDIEKEPITNHQSLITNIDIFASSFFMLTRWEEYVKNSRDKHNRFSAKDSLAYEFNFLHRPIVNEYIEYLWNMLIELGIEQKREDREYKLIMTHDVDFPLRYFSFSKLIDEIKEDLFKYKRYKFALNKLKEYILIKFNFRKDVFNTFDYMLTKEREANINSYYFFMGEGTDFRYDDNYDINSPFIKNLAIKILNYNNTIGIHPSFNTYNNPKQFTKEKQKIEEAFDIKIECGRQHYLRFEVPTTWQIWEDNNMKWDSTLSYADKEGFRCGVCYEFSVFNFLTRKKLKLKEKPLIVMEGSFFRYQSNVSMHEVEEEIYKLINIVKKYRGDFVFLWHNSAFTEENKILYEKILKGAVK